MKTNFSNGRWFCSLVIIALLFSGCTQNSSTEKTKTKPASQASGSDSAAAGSPGKSDQSVAETESPAEPILATDFPVPPGADKPMYISDTSTVMYHQVGTVDEQATFCTQQLEKLGWKKQPSSEVADGVAFLDFKKAQLSITVTINPLRDDKITTMAQGSGVLVPASLEEDESDEELPDNEESPDN